jgi:riboflavin-specific deaminase-like protein
MQPVDVSDPVWSHLLDMRDLSTEEATANQWTEEEYQAVELYGPVAARSGKPQVIGQIGQSLDGRIATVSGETRDISGPDGLAHLHRLRALVDGVVIGVKTALHDAPRLTVRLCDGPNPARVIIDPRGRLPDDAAVLREDGSRRIVIQSSNTVRPEGVEVVRLSPREGLLSPGEIIEALAERGIHSLLVEGGGFTISRFMEAGLLDRLHVAISPVLLGGGSSGLTLPSPPEHLTDAIQPETTVFQLGSDVVFDCALRADA